MKITYKEFLSHAKKDTPQVYFDYFYRLLSYPISYFFVRTNVTPNQVAVMQTVLYFIGAVVIFFGHVITGLWIFAVSYLLDFCDGNVARVVLKLSSIEEEKVKKGLMLENFNTNISYILMYGSISYYLYVLYGNITVFVVGYFAITFKLLYRYTRMHAGQSFKSAIVKKVQQPVMQRYNNSIKAKAKFFVSKSFFASNFYFALYLIVFIFLAGYSMQVFIIYAFLDVLINTIFIFRIFLRRYNLNG